MLALLIFGLTIAGTAYGTGLRVSAWAGFLAGLVFSVVYVVSQMDAIPEPSFDSSVLPDLLITPVVFGLAVGFVFLWAVRAMIPTRLVGLITLTLSAASTSALFTYVFIESLRVSILYWTLGIALGVLLHAVLFPTSLRAIFK